MVAMRRGLLPVLIAACTLCLCACRPAQPSLAPAAATEARPEIRLHYIEGSTVKVEQLIGDIDNQTKQPTLNQTLSRYSIRGTGLGYSFEHKGKAYFLFGDTIGSHDGDAMGITSSTNPQGPLALDFLTNADGSYLRIEPAGVSMAGFEVPTSRFRQSLCCGAYAFHVLDLLAELVEDLLGVGPWAGQSGVEAA
jgi:hypothetical protein